MEYTNIPKEVKRLLELEKTYNRSISFFIAWIKLLKSGKGTICPESRVYASFKDSEIKNTVVNAWRKAKNHFVNKEVREWFIDQLEQIIIDRGKIQEIYRDEIYMLNRLEQKYENKNRERFNWEIDEFTPLLMFECEHCGGIN